MDDVANPFDDPAIASRYEGWYAGAGRRADRLEKALLLALLGGFQAARTALDVGCGTGHFTRWLGACGLQVTGLDASPAMLAEARRLGTTGCMLGDAMALPFAARTFDLVFVITTLEFLPDPLGALDEAARVARQGVVVGSLNRHSLLGMRRRFSRDRLWRGARLPALGTLVRWAREAAGPRARAVRWRTTLWPLPGLGALRLPWGGFAGLALHLKEDGRGASP
jgi:ubiquinone/menaquinone biosynthesis C-methylase UbiE